MVKGKRTGKLEVTSKPKLRKVVKLVPGGEGSHQSKGPLSKYSEEAQKEYKEIAKKAKKASIEYKAELVYEKKRVGLEDMKKDMLKMMDKIDRLEDALKYLKQRVNRLDGRG